MKSILGKYEQQKKLVIFFTNDVSKFFDREVLVDCMQELASAKVDPRAYRLFYKLNRNTKIRVRMGCGFSQWEEAGHLLDQGSGGLRSASVRMDAAMKLMQVQ